MKKNILNYFAFILLTPCALAQDSLQNDDKSPAKKTPDVVDLQLVPTEPATANSARLLALQEALEEAGRIKSALKTRDIDREIAQLQNRLAELIAASRQQQEFLMRQIQERVEDQKEALDAAKLQLQADEHLKSIVQAGADGNHGGFDSSTGLGAASPQWIIGVQVQAQGNGGIKVISLIEDSPAGAAGFKKEDIILSANGLKLRNPEALRHLIQAAEDQELEFLIKRSGDAPIKLQATPKKNKDAVDRYHLDPMSAYSPYANTGLSMTNPRAKKQSDASLQRNLDRHPELKKLLNEYFEKHQKK